MNSLELSGFCLYLLCTDGEGSFEFNSRRYRITRNDLVVTVGPDRVKDLTGSCRTSCPATIASQDLVPALPGWSISQQIGKYKVFRDK